MSFLIKGDRQDASAAWGGLVFKNANKAEAFVYMNSAGKGKDDSVYFPTARYKKDAPRAMARYFCHFEKVDNTPRAGPSEAELADAKAHNYNGLILTTTGKNTFCGHYYNANGIVVSLGEFPVKVPQTN